MMKERGNPTIVPCQGGNYSSRGGIDSVVDKGDWEVQHGTMKPNPNGGAGEC